MGFVCKKSSRKGTIIIGKKHASGAIIKFFSQTMPSSPLLRKKSRDAPWHVSTIGGIRFLP